MNSHIQDVLEESTCLHDKQAVEQALLNMAEEINKHPLSKETPVFLCVAVGGIIPLVGLVLRLDFPMEIDYAHISSYRDEMQAGELIWKAEPSISLKDRAVVIVDDILDKGLTLAALINYCKEKEAKDIYSAILVDKIVDRAEGGVAKADFTGLEIENKFVFGYGLDYKGFLRNAPGIYQVADKHQD